jgi:hypothetical protein
MRARTPRSGSRDALLRPGPLRTLRATFTAQGSSKPVRFGRFVVIRSVSRRPSVRSPPKRRPTCPGVLTPHRRLHSAHLTLSAPLRVRAPARIRGTSRILPWFSSCVCRGWAPVVKRRTIDSPRGAGIGSSTAYGAARSREGHGQMHLDCFECVAQGSRRTISPISAIGSWPMHAAATNGHIPIRPSATTPRRPNGSPGHPTGCPSLASW